MSDNETIGLRVDYSVNPAGVSAALNASKSIVDSLRSINAQAAATSPAFKSIQENLTELQRRANINSIGQQFAQLAVSSKDADGTLKLMLASLKESGADSYEAAKALQVYREEVKKLSDDQKQLSVSQRNTATRSLLTNARFAISDVSRGDFGGAAVNAGQAIQRAGELGISLDSLVDKLKGTAGIVGTVATAASTAAAPLGASAAAFAAISTVLIPLVAVIGVGALALQAYQRGQEQANAATTAAAAALKAYYAELATLTTDQAKQELAQNRSELARLAQQKENLISQINQFNGVQQTFGLDGVKPLQEARDGLDKTINELIAKNKLLEDGLKGAGFATGDLAQQYKDETASFLAGIAARQGAQEKINELLKSGTTEQFDTLKASLDAQLQANEAEREAIALKLQGMPVTEENAAAVAALQARQRELTTDYNATKEAAGLLTATTREQIAAMEALRLQREFELAGYQKAAALQVQLQQLVTGGGTTAQITQIQTQIEANKQRAQTELGLIFNSGVLDEKAKERIKALTNEIALSDQQRDILDKFIATQGNEIAHREELQKAIEQSIKASDLYAESLRRQADLRANATSEQLATNIAEVESKQQIIEQQRAYVLEQIKTLGSSDAFTAKLKDLDAQMSKLATERGDIEAVAGIVALRDTLKTLSDAFHEGASATQKYAADVAKIEQDAAEKRADIALSYNDKLIDIARESAEKAADALRDAQRKIADETTDLSRDLAKDQRKAQDDDAKVTLDYRRSEARAFREHLKDLEKIRREAQDKEFELAVNRDFAGLFFSRRDTARKLNESNIDFISQRQSQAESLRIKLQDSAKERAIEARERVIAFNDKIADARRNYQRELADLRTNTDRQRAEAALNRDRALRDLQIANARDFAEKQNAYTNELNLIRQKTKERLDLIASEQASITGSIGNIFTSLANGAVGVLRSISGLFGGGGTAGTRSVTTPTTPTVRRPGTPLPAPSSVSYVPFATGGSGARGGGATGVSSDGRSIVINVQESSNPRATAREVQRQLEVFAG